MKKIEPKIKIVKLCEYGNYEKDDNANIIFRCKYCFKEMDPNETRLCGRKIFEEEMKENSKEPFEKPDTMFLGNMLAKILAFCIVVGGIFMIEWVKNKF
jgi:hypothetical protein